MLKYFLYMYMLPTKKKPVLVSKKKKKKKKPTYLPYSKSQGRWKGKQTFFLIAAL